MPDPEDDQPVAPQNIYLRFLATGLFLVCVAAGIAVGIRAGRAAYHLVVRYWSGEVVYGYCYRFDGEPLGCQPGEAPPDRGVTVEPGNHVLTLGCYSECFRRESPVVYRKVPIFGDYPGAEYLVGMLVGVIAAISTVVLCLWAWEVVMERVKRRRESRGADYGY